MKIVLQAACLLLVVMKSAAYDQPETFSEMDKLRLLVREQIWEQAVEFRIMTRADLALGYLNLDGHKIDQEAARSELGFSKEELARWSAMKSSDFSKSLNTALQPIREKFEKAKSIEEIDGLFGETDNIAFEQWDRVQSQILEEIGPERLDKLRKMGLRLSPLLEEESPLIDFKAYEFLDLSEEQKKKLKIMRDEYVQDADKFIKETEDFYCEILELEIRGEEILPDELEAIRKKGEALQENFLKAFRLSKSKINTLLNRKQTERLEKILSEKPSWLKDDNDAEPANDSWKNSWKPGDPIPETGLPIHRQIFPVRSIQN